MTLAEILAGLQEQAPQPQAQGKEPKWLPFARFEIVSNAAKVFEALVAECSGENAFSKVAIAKWGGRYITVFVLRAAVAEFPSVEKGLNHECLKLV